MCTISFYNPKKKHWVGLRNRVETTGQFPGYRIRGCITSRPVVLRVLIRVTREPTTPTLSSPHGGGTSQEKIQAFPTIRLYKRDGPLSQKTHGGPRVRRFGRGLVPGQEKVFAICLVQLGRGVFRGWMEVLPTPRHEISDAPSFTTWQWPPT